jgi:hypothetical protein
VNSALPPNHSTYPLLGVLLAPPFCSYQSIDCQESIVASWPSTTGPLVHFISDLVHALNSFSFLSSHLFHTSHTNLALFVSDLVPVAHSGIREYSLSYNRFWTCCANADRRFDNLLQTTPDRKGLSDACTYLEQIQRSLSLSARVASAGAISVPVANDLHLDVSHHFTV